MDSLLGTLVLLLTCPKFNALGGSCGTPVEVAVYIVTEIVIVVAVVVLCYLVWQYLRKDRK